MVVDFFLGASICIISYFSFLRLNFFSSLTDWIFQISKFVYLIGHPTLTEDQIHDRIKFRFRAVLGSFVKVFFKTLFFLLILVSLLFAADFVSASFQEREFISLGRYSGASLWSLSILTNYAFLSGTVIPLFIIPFLGKEKKQIKSDYTIIDKFLHYVFIGNKNVAKFLFKTELLIRKNEIGSFEEDKNVYVSGLARAGTTALMQYLGQLENFRSISYRNLPFLFMPKTGLKIFSSDHERSKERFHKDGLQHSLSSYEALEEPFWRNFMGEKYIFESSLNQHSIDQEVYSRYRKFRKLIAGERIYLAKNNNHLLRAKSLIELDGEKGSSTRTVIPFRNPVDHAKSLLKQHVLLSEEQDGDEFVRDYMDFLVHHEFGRGTKIQIFENGFQTKLHFEQNNINYWLEVWYSYYKSVKQEFADNDNFVFFNYENFVSHPKYSLEKIFEFLGMTTNLVNEIEFKNFSQKNTMENYMMENDSVEWDKFIRLYNELLNRSINKL